MPYRYLPENGALLLLTGGNALKFTESGTFLRAQGEDGWTSCWPHETGRACPPDRYVGRAAFKKILDETTSYGQGQGLLLSQGDSLDGLRLFLGGFEREYVRLAALYKSPWPVLYMLHEHGERATSLCEEHPALALAAARSRLFVQDSNAEELHRQDPERIAIRLGFRNQLSLLQKVDVGTVTVGDLLALRYLIRHSTELLYLLRRLRVITGLVINVILLITPSLLSKHLLDEIATTPRQPFFRDDLEALSECERLAKKLDVEVDPIESRNELQLCIDRLKHRGELQAVGLAGHPMEGQGNVEPVTSLDDLREKIRQAGLQVSWSFRSLREVKQWKLAVGSSEEAPVYFARMQRERAFIMLERRRDHWHIGRIVARNSELLRSNRKAIRDWWRDEQTTTWTYTH